MAVLDRWLHEVTGLWEAGDYTFVLVRLGLLQLGCILGRSMAVLCLLRFHCIVLHLLHMVDDGAVSPPHPHSPII